MRRSVRYRLTVGLCCLTTLLPLLAHAQDDAREPYFSLSSQQTYMPGEKPEVAVYSHNISS